MMEIKVWILTATLSIVIIVLGFLLKAWFSDIIKKLDELVDEIKTITKNSASQEQRIENIKSQIKDQSHRLNNHSDRIRDLELKK